MESFAKSSPPPLIKSPRASSRRSKDHPLKPSPPPSPPPPACATDSSTPSSSDLKFRVSLAHPDASCSLAPSHGNAPCDPWEEKGSREKFMSMQSLTERSDDTERVLDSERDTSARPSVCKRGRIDDHHRNRCYGSEKSSKSTTKEEKDVDGIVVSIATRKHVEVDKKNGRDGDNRFSKGSSCLQAEPSALHREDLREAKSASKSSLMRDLGAQMDVDRVSPKEKKTVSVSRLPLKKAFKTLRALNEVGNHRDCMVKKSEHGSTSGGENMGAPKRARPSKSLLEGEDDGEHTQDAECGASIKDFPIKFSHISKRARSHRERRNHEKVGMKGGNQEDSEGKPEEASKQEGLFESVVGEDRDARVQGEDGAVVSSEGADTKEEDGDLEVKGAAESREVQLDPDGNLAFEGDSKEQHTSPEGAKAASNRKFMVLESVDANNPIEMLAGIAIGERMSQGASELETGGHIHTVVSDKDRKTPDRLCEQKEHEMVQDVLGEKDHKILSDVHSADGAVSTSTAMEMHESSKGGLTVNFPDKGPVGKGNHANQSSVHEGLDTSNQLTLPLFAKCTEAEGSKVKELTIEQDFEKKKILERAHQLQACSIQNGLDNLGKVGDDHASHGHGEKSSKLGSCQLSLALPGTSHTQAVSHTLNAKGPTASTRSFQSPSRSHTHRSTFDAIAKSSELELEIVGSFESGSGFSSSFSQSFFRNPNCSLDCTPLDTQELSCEGSKQWSQANTNFSQWSRQTGTANDQHSLVSLSQERSKHRPGITFNQWNLQNGSMHGFPSASGSNRICENNDVSQRNQALGLKSQVDSKVLDLNRQDLEGPGRQGIKCKDLSGRSSHQEEAALHLLAARDTQSEPRAQRDRERVQHHPASPPRGFSHSKNEDARGDQDLCGGKIGLREIATEPVAVMAQKMQELPDSFLVGLKGLAKDLLGSFEKREEFLTLQSIIKSRTDLTEHALLHAQQTQLEILVAFKTGLQDFVQEGAKPLTYKVLTEIFFQTRCRNTSCQQSLPVYGCDCKICTEKKGFCHDCMCVVCTKFDLDNHTCRWVGCNLCLHWCHSDCGLRMSYITSAPSSQGEAGSTEMHYQCVACGHHSELFGFVKEVFQQYADIWGAETLTRELDCVRRIFHGSEDTRGKQLCKIIEQMLQKLEKQVDTAEIRQSILQYFRDVDTNEGATARKQSLCGKTNEATNERTVAAQDVAVQVERSVANRLTDDKARGMLQSYERELLVDRINETAELQVGKARKRAEIESMVRMKQAEANMLQLRADEAHREARGLQQIIIVKQEKIEDDYVCKYAKLKLNEAEDKRRKRFMELQALERAHLDYERMKHKIQAQIQDLAMKMEMANWQYAQMT